MRTLRTDACVISGGSTGAGAVRDVTMCGFSTVLVDRADIAQGTSGRFHGLSHSGGRCIASDPEPTTECAEENEIIERIGANAVKVAGGLFVVTAHDDEEHTDQFLARVAATRVPTAEISITEALRREPRLGLRIERAFEVQDGTVNGQQMIWETIRSAQAYGAQVLTYHRVTSIEHEGEHISAVTVHDGRGGEDVRIEYGFVLNYGDPWAGQIATVADCHGADVVPGAGTMVAMNYRLSQSVISRCVWPADDDTLTPDHAVCIIDMTDLKTDNPDRLSVPTDQVQQMLDSGEAMIPNFRKSHVVHAWAGARPLIRDSRVSATDTRHMARDMSIIDHNTRDGVYGVLTIAGDKLATYRLMAKRIVGTICEEMGEKCACKTADEAVPPAKEERLYTIGRRLGNVESRNEPPSYEQTIYECEMATRAMLENVMDTLPKGQLDDVHRQVRLDMGPCQDGFCSQRAIGIAHERGDIDPVRANSLLRLFLKNHWIGLWPIMFDKQARQAALNAWIHKDMLDVEHLPAPSEGAVR